MNEHKTRGSLPADVGKRKHPAQSKKSDSPRPPATPVSDHSGPRIVVSQRGANRIRSGHPWVYRSDIRDVRGAAPGTVARVSDPAGNLLGSASYSSSSQIALRMLADTSVAAEQFPDLLRARIAAALEFRRRVVDRTDACRVIFSEADFLPGLIVDRYNDLLSVQFLTQTMDRPETRELVVQELAGHFHPAGIIDRIDPRIRELEQLPPKETGLLYGGKTNTIFTMNGVRFHYDGAAGQKTGAFLDQRENYEVAACYARGLALDVFCYQGGFALHLAKHCEHVTGVDSSREALQAAEKNAALNGREMEWMEANAFDLLKDYAAAGRQYDTVVLDPPAFAKTRRALETALRGYKELNLRALKMLRSQGLLITCSCSYHVSEAEFLQVIAAAARDAHRQVRILERRTQAKDHPILLSVPETQYLKCVIAAIA